MRGIFVLVIVAIVGSSLLGVGHMSGNQDDSYSGWLKTFSKYFDFKKLSGFLNSGGSDDDDDDDCDCEDRKNDHKRHYDDFKKDYDDHKKYYSKGDYKKHLDDFKKYFDDNKHDFDKEDFKQYMDYHKKFLDDNKKYFDYSDYKKYDDDHKKYYNEYPKHDDKCKCDDDHDDKSAFFVGGGKVYVKNYGSDKFTLTHGFELHCDKTQAPNNLEINWLKNRFHLEELETAECIDDGTPNEPPPSPHPGPTLDVYTGSGYGRYNGVCGAFATWSMDDNGEPGKNDHILSLQIKDKNGNTVLNINNALNLQTGNHQFVPHKSSHPNPPTQTTPCPEVTP